MKQDPCQHASYAALGSDKAKVSNADKINRLVKLTEALKDISDKESAGKTATVTNRATLEAALNNSDIAVIQVSGKIETDAGTFDSNYGRYTISRNLKICGSTANDQLLKTTLKPSNGAVLVLDNITIDNTRTYGSTWQSMNPVDVYADSAVMVLGKTNLMTQYGRGDDSYGIELRESNAGAYIDTESEIWASYSAVKGDASTSEIILGNGTLQSKAQAVAGTGSYYAVDTYGSLTINGGTVQDICVEDGAELFLKGGTIDTDNSGNLNKKTPIYARGNGKIYASAGTVKAYNQKAIQLDDAAQLHMMANVKGSLTLGDLTPYLPGAVSESNNTAVSVDFGDFGSGFDAASDGLYKASAEGMLTLKKLAAAQDVRMTQSYAADTYKATAAVAKGESPVVYGKYQMTGANKTNQWIDTAKGETYVYGTSKQVNNVLASGLAILSAPTHVKAGGNGYVSWQVTPSNAMNKEVTWSSDKAQVATVSRGRIHGTGAGTAVITAALKENPTVTQTINVTVVDPKTSGSSVTSVNKTENYTITTGLASDAGYTWKWSVTDGKDIAEITEDGTLTAKAAGIVKLKAQGYYNGQILDGISVSKEILVTDLKVTGGSDITAVGCEPQTYVLETGLNDPLPKKYNVQWTVSDDALAEVKNGTLTAKAAGQITLTAAITCEDENLNVTAEKTVTILKPEITGPEELNLSDGSAVYTASTGLNNNAGYSFDWEVSDTTAATIDGNGRLTLKNAGDVELIAYVRYGERLPGIRAVKTVKIIQTYPITYHLNGGSEESNQENPTSYVFGTGVETFKQPVREGYVFAGWYSDAALTAEVTAISSRQTGAMDLYAKWNAISAEKPQITLQPESAVYQTTDTAEELKTEAEVSDNGTLSYQWYRKTDTSAAEEKIDGANEKNYTPEITAAGITYYFCRITNTNENATGEISVTADTDTAMIVVTDTASGETNYIVTFRSDGGSFVDPVMVKAGEKAEKPEDPVREGYLFKGWFAENEETEFDFDTEIRQNVTLTARWEEKTDAQIPVITGQPSDKTYTLGDTAEELRITAETADNGTLSYQWYKNSQDSLLGAEAIADAAEAVYTPDVSETGVTYYFCKVTNTNSQVTGNQTAEINSRIAAITVDEKVGYTIEYYTQNLSRDAYEQRETEEGRGKPGETVTAEKKEYPGFTCDTSVAGTKASGVVRKDGLLVLKLYYTRNVYPITYHYITGLDETENPAEYVYGAGVAELQNPTREGYTFAGWYLNENLTGEAVTAIAKDQTEAVHLYAKWTKKEETTARFIVTFDTDGGSSVASQSVAEGEKAVKPENPVKEGYTFKGWYLGEAEYSFDTEITADITLKAVWENSSNGGGQDTGNQNTGNQNTGSQNNGGQNNGGQNGTGNNTGNSDADAKLEAEKQQAQAGTISLTQSAKAITTANTDKSDPKGSTFSALKVKAKEGNKCITLSWKKMKGADGYIIYGAACGKKMKEIKEVAGSKKSFKVTGLAKGKYYKYVVTAYKNIYGEKRVVATSVSVHSTTKGGKYGNPSGVKYSKSKVTVKKGKTMTLKPTLKLKGKSKTHIAKIRFESSNSKVASVDKKGKVKGKKKGKCYIYMYAQNGSYKRISVTVN